MKAPSRVSRMLLLWAISIIILNVIWSNVAQMNAVQELNDFDRDVDETTNITISKFFNSKKAMPVEIETQTKGGQNSGEIFSWSLSDSTGAELYSWSGDFNTSIPTWRGELSPGVYTVTVEQPDYVNVKQFAEIMPLAPHEITVRILLNLGLITIGIIDFLLRRKISDISKKRPEKKIVDVTPPSFKKLSSFEEAQDFDDDSSPWRDPITES